MLHFEPPANNNPRPGTIVGWLNLARGQNAAVNLSRALQSIQEQASARRLVLSNAQAEAIIAALEAASTDALALFQDHAEKAFALHAIGEAKTLVRYWACSGNPNDGSAWGIFHHEWDAFHMAISHVTWLRNCCDNFALLDEIEKFHTTRAKDVRRARSLSSTRA